MTKWRVECKKSAFRMQKVVRSECKTNDMPKCTIHEHFCVNVWYISAYHFTCEQIKMNL